MIAYKMASNIVRVCNNNSFANAAQSLIIVSDDSIFAGPLILK